MSEGITEAKLEGEDNSLDCTERKLRMTNFMEDDDYHVSAFILTMAKITFSGIIKAYKLLILILLV